MQMELFLTPPKQVAKKCWRRLYELGGEVFHATVLIITETRVNQVSCLHIFSVAGSEGRAEKSKCVLV